MNCRWTAVLCVSPLRKNEQAISLFSSSILPMTVADRVLRHLLTLWGGPAVDGQPSHCTTKGASAPCAGDRDTENTCQPNFKEVQ